MTTKPATPLKFGIAYGRYITDGVMEDGSIHINAKIFARLDDAGDKAEERAQLLVDRANAYSQLVIESKRLIEVMGWQAHHPLHALLCSLGEL